MNTQQYFRLSEEFVDEIIRPMLDRYLESCSDMVHKRLCTLVFKYYSQKEEGKHKICDTDTFGEDVEDFFFNTLLPMLGIEPGEHAGDIVEKTGKMLRSDLLRYFNTHTHKLDKGEILRIDDTVYLKVYPYKEEGIITPKARAERIISDNNPE